ncbi:hypothetical protein MUK42_10860, partial [Musa troglodytarum]
SPLPPRFLRGGSQPSRWSQASGAAARSSSSSSLPGASQGSTVVPKKTSVNTAPAAVTRRRGGNSSGGRKAKSSGSSNRPSSSSSPPPPQQQQQQSSGGSRRSWKNRSKSGSSESRFLFKEVESEESSESSCRDSRTTVMIKNIPNKYRSPTPPLPTTSNQKLLLNMLDNHCIQCNEQIGEGADEPYSAYDFVYLPIDFNNKCNVGYGFVNLTSPEAAFRLYKAFHQQPWEVFNSRKICQVTYARLQVATVLSRVRRCLLLLPASRCLSFWNSLSKGLEALKEHFRRSKFACDNEEYMPVVFSPPRDGSQLSEPVPVVAVGSEERLGDLSWTHCEGADASQQVADSGGASSTTTSTHAPSDNADGGDDDDDDDDDNDDDDVVGSGGGEETSVGLSEAVLHLSFN